MRGGGGGQKRIDWASIQPFIKPSSQNINGNPKITLVASFDNI